VTRSHDLPSRTPTAAESLARSGAGRRSSHTGMSRSPAGGESLAANPSHDAESGAGRRGDRDNSSRPMTNNDPAGLHSAAARSIPDSDN
jgi:hypothetical protein